MLQQNLMCMLQTDVKKKNMHLAWTCSCRSKSCPTSAVVQLLEKMHTLCMLPTYFTLNMHYPLIHLHEQSYINRYVINGSNRVFTIVSHK